MDLPSDSMDNRYPIDVRLESRMVDAMRLFVSLRSHGMLGWHAETYSSDPLSAGSFRKNGRVSGLLDPAGRPEQPNIRAVVRVTKAWQTRWYRGGGVQQAL